MQNFIRQPAVAGLFYPADPAELQQAVQGYLHAVKPHEAEPSGVPKAIVAPHAGYIYSGPVAASAYARLSAARQAINRVVLLGPSHRIPLRGLASSSATHFQTPLGRIALDRETIAMLEKLPQVQQLDSAHAGEHSLEVHLPFLQTVLDHFTLIPLVVGEASPEEIGEVLELLWGAEETLIVISSDLSHYHDYLTACKQDRATSDAIEALDGSAIHYEDACGRNPLNGLLLQARRHQMHAQTLDLRNSGDTAGDRARVVGYGAYAFH